MFKPYKFTLCTYGAMPCTEVRATMRVIFFMVANYFICKHLGKNIPSPAAVRQTEARPLDGSANPFGAALREAARPSRVLWEISHCVFRNERSGLWLCRPRSFGIRRVYLCAKSMAGFWAAERCEADRNKTFKGRGNQYAAAHLCSRILKGAKSKGVGWQPGALWLLVDIA